MRQAQRPRRLCMPHAMPSMHAGAAPLRVTRKLPPVSVTDVDNATISFKLELTGMATVTRGNRSGAPAFIKLLQSAVDSAWECLRPLVSLSAAEAQRLRLHRSRRPGGEFTDQHRPTSSRVAAVKLFSRSHGSPTQSACTELLAFSRSFHTSLLHAW